MISKKVLFIIGLIVALLVGVCVFLIYKPKKDNFYNISLPLASVSGRYVKINAPAGQPINIAGVFIYGKNGNNLITNQTYAMANVSMNSEYSPANKALDIIFATDSNGTNNVNRNINDSPLIFQNYRYTQNSGSAYILSQTWQGMNANIAHSMGGVNALDYWQYDFGSDIDISAVEIYTRTDCCPERNINLTVQVINSNGNISLLNTPAAFAPVIISTVVSNQIVGSTYTTAGATSTTVDSTSTTSGATSTTAGDTSTIAGATSTTAGATSTTATIDSTTSTKTDMDFTSKIVDNTYTLTQSQNIYPSISCRYITINAPKIQIAGLIIIDETGNNLQYRPSDYMPTMLNTTYFDGINNADASIIYNQTKNINFDIYKHTVVNDMYNNNIINIIHKNDKTLIGTINCADKQNSFTSQDTSQDISQIIIDLGSKINISTIILFPYIKKECDYKYAGHLGPALEKVKDSNNLYSCSLGMMFGNIVLLDENKNHLFSWRLIKTMPNETYTIYNSVLLEKDINGNYNPSKNIFFIVESQNKLSFKNIPKIYEKFDINIAPANNHNYDNSINPNVNNGNSINPILELSMNTIKPDIDVIPSINTIKPSISALPNISEDIIGISNNVTMPKLNMPAMPQIPIATPGMITNLLNNGIGIDYLTSQGMALNSAYRGPSTNIVQTNFSGTSNVYSPFLYYNKGSSEKFIDKLYHPYP